MSDCIEGVQEAVEEYGEGVAESARAFRTDCRLKTAADFLEDPAMARSCALLRARGATCLAETPPESCYPLERDEGGGDIGRIDGRKAYFNFSEASEGEESGAAPPGRRSIFFDDFRNAICLSMAFLGFFLVVWRRRESPRREAGACAPRGQA